MREKPDPSRRHPSKNNNHTMTPKKKEKPMGEKTELVKPEPPAPEEAISPESAEPRVVKSAAPEKKSKPRWLWITIGAIGLGAIAGAGFVLTKSSPGQPIANQGAVNTNAPMTVARKLDGLPVLVDAANPNIYAVMVENAVDSRPPSGLDKASVVYEALAEGGITRFLALWPVGQNIAEIGPVRSARKYFVEWAEEYKPLYVHSGGSPDSLSYLQSRNTNVIDFNQFRHGPNFIRDKTRRVPHNLYTSTDLLYLGLKRLAPEAVPDYQAWVFGSEAPLDGRPAAVADIVVDFSSFNYKVTYKYDRALNQYQRYQGEAPHVTRDNSNVFAKNVIVQFTKTQATGDAQKRLSIETVGEGKAIVFRDGLVTVGTWKKDSPSGRTTWTDNFGQPIKLNPGPVWISFVPADRKVVY